MADIALVTADRVSLGRGAIGDGHLAPPVIAGEAITAGAPVFLNGTTGRVYNADANDAAKDEIYGIALKTVVASEAVSVAYGKAILDGYDLSGMNFGALAYVSNTVGRLADAAGGTSLPVGRVVPASLGGAVASNVNDKLLELDL